MPIPRALPALFTFLNTFRFDMDLRKRWGWGSTATMSRLWQVASSAVLGHPDAATVKDQAIDLGFRCIAVAPRCLATGPLARCQ